jgi:prepilin-type N-terminal cleavage/methylation domain-containing protein
MKCINKKGFSLVEMAVVLVILGLVIGTTAPLMKALTRKSNISAGKKTVNQAVDEVVGYMMMNDGRIPVGSAFQTEITTNEDPWKKALIYTPGKNYAQKEDICTSSTNELAFSIVSTGADYSAQFEWSNANTQALIDANKTAAEAMPRYDDIVVTMSTGVLLGRVCSSILEQRSPSSSTDEDTEETGSP